MLLMWYWEVYWLTMSHWKYRILVPERSHLTQTPQFSYTDINKEPPVCKLMLVSREELEESDIVQWVTKTNIQLTLPRNLV